MNEDNSKNLTWESFNEESILIPLDTVQNMVEITETENGSESEYRPPSNEDEDSIEERKSFGHYSSSKIVTGKRKRSDTDDLIEEVKIAAVSKR